MIGMTWIRVEIMYNTLMIYIAVRLKQWVCGLHDKLVSLDFYTGKNKVETIMSQQST